MRALVQRAREASVSVDGRVVGAIGAGLVVLAGMGTGDGDDDREWLVRKIVALRIFDDDAGVMNRSVIETGGDILAVSEFTLDVSTKNGGRSSWFAAGAPEIAAPAFLRFVAALTEAIGKPIETGVFGAAMEVALVNDGPVTIWLDSSARE